MTYILIAIYLHFVTAYKISHFKTSDCVFPSSCLILQGLQANVNDFSWTLVKKIIDLVDNDKLERAEEVLKRYSVMKLKELNEDLEKQVEHLRKSNAELVAKIVQLNNKLNETKN